MRRCGCASGWERQGSEAGHRAQPAGVLCHADRRRAAADLPCARTFHRLANSAHRVILISMHTDEQMAVILHEEGHAKVGAVAGSGKTTTMVSRIEQLLRWGADPRRIRVLMFNKSAQEEFSARLRRKMPDAPALPTVQTFHGLGHRL